MLEFLEMLCMALVFFGIPVLTYALNKWAYNNT